jgi:hypothetical protein
VDHVLYVETTGFKFLPRTRSCPDATQIQIVSAWNLIPKAGDPRFALARYLNSVLTLIVVLRAIRRTSDGPAFVPLLVSFDPLSHLLSRWLRAERKLYDCLDLYREQPQYAGSRSKQHSLDRAEHLLAGVVDCIAISASSLASRFQGSGKPIVFVAGAPMPPVLQLRSKSARFEGERKNFAIYVGALDRYKVDFRVFEAILGADESIRLIIIGRPEYSDAETRRKIEQISAIERVEVRPPVGRMELLNLARHARFGIVAMQANAYSDGSFPLKYWDYLWAGIPVLSVGSKSLREMLVGVVSVGDAAQITQRTLAELADAGRDPDVLSEFAAANSALARVKRILQ